MSFLSWVALYIAFASAFAILSVFLFYPILLMVAPGRNPNRGKPSGNEPMESGNGAPLPPITLIVVARNAEDLILDKIRNCLKLDYPEGQTEFLFVSDGSEDQTLERLQLEAQKDSRISVDGFVEHRGKTAGLNHASTLARGEILVFSDADALLDPQALRRVADHFKDPKLGGVCGARKIGTEGHSLKSAQSRYISLDSKVKELESARGRITSNDGKLYALRAKLFRPIPDAVTDDLFSCLTVIAQKYDFIFDPELVASIRVPSRGAAHELRRRRRIVSRSLRGIFYHRRLLNPFQFGLFSLGLLINKVFRRFLPAFLILLFAACFILAQGAHPWVWAARWLLGGQCLFYALAILYPLTGRRLGKLPSMAYYFCVGNWAMFLGVIDFLLGRRTLKWDPLKSDR